MHDIHFFDCIFFSFSITYFSICSGGGATATATGDADVVAAMLLAFSNGFMLLSCRTFDK